jgi:hypothetical protein
MVVLIFTFGTTTRLMEQEALLAQIPCEGEVTKGMGMDKIEVKCYSGHTYAQRPESFFWQDKEHKISKIEREWLEPGKKFFRVATEDEKVFELCYNEAQDKWWLFY